MKRQQLLRRRRCGGFTLTELLIASSVSLTVMAVAIGIYVNIYRSWRGIDQRMQADRDVNIAMSRLVYGMNERRGIRSANDVTFTSNSVGWTMLYEAGVKTPQTNVITYSAPNKTLVLNPGSQLLGTNISAALVYMRTHSVVITLRVERVEGTLQAKREIGTEIFWRN